MTFTEFDVKIFASYCKLFNETTDKSKVTIGAIAKELGVSRQAIYKTYYNSIDSLLVGMHYYVDQDIKNYFTELIDSSKDTPFVELIMYGLIPRLYEKRLYLHVIYANSSDTNWANFLEQQYIEVIMTKIDNSTLREMNLDRRLVADMVINQFTSFVSVWMRMDKIYSPEEAANLFKNFYIHSLSDVIKS